jgi:hypothetical protein
MRLEGLVTSKNWQTRCETVDDRNEERETTSLASVLVSAEAR